jgi:hypothetical protein
MNALFIFALSGFVARMLVLLQARRRSALAEAALYAAVQALPLAPVHASLLWALLFNALMFAVAWWMWTAALVHQGLRVPAIRRRWRWAPLRRWPPACATPAGRDDPRAGAPAAAASSAPPGWPRWPTSTGRAGPG